MIKKDSNKIWSDDRSWFDVKYDEVLRTLSAMRHDTAEAKKERVSFFKSQVDFDLFVTEALQAVKPSQYTKLKRDLGANWSGTIIDDIVDGENDETYGFQRLDNVAFMEAINGAIEHYENVKDGTDDSFRRLIGTIYKRQYGKTRLDNGDFSGADIKTKISLYKLVEKISAMKSGECSTNDLLEKVMALRSESDNLLSKFTENQIRICVDITLRGEKLSLQNTLSGYDGADNYSLEDSIPDSNSENGYIETDEKELIRSICEKLTQMMKDGTWNLRKKPTRYFKILLTHNILKELKSNNDVIYQEVPAGNEEIYRLIADEGEDVLTYVFLGDYLEYLYINYPEDFYAVYSSLFKPKFVRFEDSMMADCLGIDKSTISNQKKKYRSFIQVLNEYT